MAQISFSEPEPRLGGKLKMLPWLFILMVLVAGLAGGGALYSAANGSFMPWAKPHLIRFGISVAVMLAFGLIDIRVWYRLAYPTYLLMLALLAGVEVAGKVGAFGAQRWINLGFVQIQPSELMKIALVMALARYFHPRLPDEVRQFRTLVVPVLMILAPTAFVLLQPNLGTAIMLLLAGAAMMFVAGTRIWLFVLVGVAGLAAAPVAWHSMHGYQKRRVTTFLDPSVDPLGAGYHITQSRIALGSGGLFGKGFLNGTQSHLNFLPEKQTDFIFPLIAEEWGLWGGAALLGLFALIAYYGIGVGLRSRSQFGRMLAIGLSVNLFLYVFINTAMVMGLIPVVGVPLPLISYGGTSMLAVMMGFGMLISVLVHRDIKISRRYPLGD
ncbi:MAG TPA: rod shape-determining protein RodA [Alphaproteobacteria bacterium]|nr:rod shape-determining protein RodA [Alphaproteobacteria bacterium]